MRAGMDLSGRSALLTGATGGLGRAIAAALAAKGARLTLSGRKAEALEALAEELPGEGHARYRPTWPSPAPRRSSPPKRGRSTSSIANAGLPGAGLLTDFTPEQVTRALRVNLEAPMLMARAL